MRPEVHHHVRWEGWTLKTEEEVWCTGTQIVLSWKNPILTLNADMFPEQIKTQLSLICNPFVCLPYSAVIIHWFIICSPHVRGSKTVLGCVPLRWSGSVIRHHLDHGRSNEPMNPLWTRIHRFIWVYHDPSNLGSLILIQIIPKERTLRDSGFRRGLQIQGTGFQSKKLVFFRKELGFQILIVSGIPDPLSCIPSSKAQNDERCRRSKEDR